MHGAYEPLNKIKAPKALADALGWIEQALSEFGIAGLSLRGLIEFLKGALKNSNAAVRTSATKTLVMVKLFAGSSIVDLLGDLNPQLLATIQRQSSTRSKAIRLQNQRDNQRTSSAWVSREALKAREAPPHPEH